MKTHNTDSTIKATTLSKSQVAVEASPTITWKLDAVHSSVHFAIRHMVISEVTGKFKNFDLTLIQIADDFSDSKVEAVIQVDSITTDNVDRDNHLKSTDFFDAEKFPEITFKGKSFKKSGDDTYTITGDLTMHGMTKSVDLKVNYYGQGVDPWGNIKAGFKAMTTLNRYDFDLQWNQALEAGGLIVGKTVEVTLNLELIRQK